MLSLQRNVLKYFVFISVLFVFYSCLLKYLIMICGGSYYKFLLHVYFFSSLLNCDVTMMLRHFFFLPVYSISCSLSCCLMNTVGLELLLSPVKFEDL